VSRSPGPSEPVAQVLARQKEASTIPKSTLILFLIDPIKFSSFRPLSPLSSPLVPSSGSIDLFRSLKSCQPAPRNSQLATCTSHLALHTSPHLIIRFKQQSHSRRCLSSLSRRSQVHRGSSYPSHSPPSQIQPSDLLTTTPIIDLSMAL
jgi:hypothetical protein